MAAKVVLVSRHLVDSYVPRVRVGEIDGLTSRAREAAGGLAHDGNEVRYLRSSFLPEDEMWLLWHDAPIRELVGEAGRRAELDFARIVEAIDRSARRTPMALTPTHATKALLLVVVALVAARFASPASCASAAGESTCSASRSRGGVL